MEKSWKCEKCGRLFRKRGQIHSCDLITESHHFKGKKAALLPLYNEFLVRTRRKAGPFRIEALRCCIHLVAESTFAAVYAAGGRLRIHFSSEKELGGPRIRASQRFSANRFMNEVSIKDCQGIDSELLGWLKQARELGKRK